MALMQGLQTSGRTGRYEVRVVIPQPLRERFFDGRTEFKSALGTRDELTALERGAPIVAEIRRQIGRAWEAHRANRPLTAASARDGFTAWARGVISGELGGFTFAADDCDVVGAARECLEMVTPALASQGIETPIRGSVLDHRVPGDRPYPLDLGSEWGRTYVHTRARKRGQDVAEAAVVTVDALLERFVASQRPADEGATRYAWRRFSEWFANADIRTITAPMVDEWIVGLRRMPVTRKPDVVKLGMREIVEREGVAPGTGMAPKTVWKTVGLVARGWAWAHKMGMVEANTVGAAMPRKPGTDDRVKERRAYTAAELAEMFGQPLFTGFAGRADWGYRHTPGATVVRDAKFWLPILNLFHGSRLEEFGGARMAELGERDGVIAFNWLERRLKTPQASRLLPLHPKVLDMGFHSYIAERRAAADEWLFPDLPHRAGDDGSFATAQFSKWWGLWMDKAGMPEDEIDFHSLRHTFKRACRGVISEEMSDLLTGHRGIGGVGRIYGAGAEPARLLEALARIDFPTFPL